MTTIAHGQANALGTETFDGSTNFYFLPVSFSGETFSWLA